MDNILDKLTKGIIETHSSEFKFKLDEVISMGESPIEKMMLLQLFNYFQKYGRVGKERDDIERHFTEIEFIEEEICLWDDYGKPLSFSDQKMLEDKIDRFNYRSNNCMFYKNIGFKCTIGRSEPIYLIEAKNNNSNSIIFRDIEVRPQFYETVDQSAYRIDIAFILKRRDWFDKDNIIDIKKIAIECDGYDYHSSPDQKRADDIRSRQLKRLGWKEILRYSGSEIYRTNDNLSLTHHKFEEIMDIILL